MLNNKNIFSVTNPARMADALWRVMCDSGVDVADMLIFLPSRRAVRTVEKMIAERSGGVAILPTLVALGSGIEDADENDNPSVEIISNTERVVVLARLLAEDAQIGNIITALSVARDLVRMQDYLENEGIDAGSINWVDLVDEKYAGHFQDKAKILNILSSVMTEYAGGRITSTMARNRDIRAWIDVLDKYGLVIVCSSTASVPATADLMVAVANSANGRIILPGKISGRECDFELDTNPYNAEYKFLTRLGLGADDVVPIDVGPSVIDFMNYAFGNECKVVDVNRDLSNCNLIEVGREAVEADVVAEIVSRAMLDGKSVLVITPDAAGNQRIANSLNARGVVADFSGGVSGMMSAPGRAILNLLDGWIEDNSLQFDKLYAENNFDLFDTVATIIDMYQAELCPQFDVLDSAWVQIWIALRDMSNALRVAGVCLGLRDARAMVADALGGVSIRGQMNDDADVVVLGTIESRMQTADVVILTGLNDGMFPARGYENAWLPRHLAQQIGLPSPDRKVSLQALDFMNLSCGKCVYWVRSVASGGVQSTESRFISRVIARNGKYNIATDIRDAVLARDDVPLRTLDYSVPTPPADWSDVFVTELEVLIHNPYAFYVRHILRLRVLDDYWVGPDARQFGNLVHKVIEDADDWNPDVLVAKMDKMALDLLGRDNIIFHFWHKRFLEIAPVVSRVFGGLVDVETYAEKEGCVKIAGRNVRGRADRVWDGVVLDIKTGQAPTASKLLDGNMPQLPLEAYMLRQGGFPIHTTAISRAPIIQFLQLRNNDVRLIEYDADTVSQMIDVTVDKVTGLINMYSAGGAGYEYHETKDYKYKQYDDLARIND